MLNHLLTNIKEITKSTNKESHFGRHWGVVAGFQKQIDKSSYSLMPSAKKHSKDEITEQVLATFTTNLSDQQVSFIQSLTDKSLSFLAEHKDSEMAILQQNSIYNKSMSRLVQSIFSTLQIYSFSLNSAVSFSELYSTATKPEWVQEATRFSKYRETTETKSAYRARISTTYQSLVVRGRGNRIDFIIIPVEKAIGLSKSEIDYAPLTSLIASLKDGEVEWSCSGQICGEKDIESICMQVFQALIEKTKESIEQEYFLSCTSNTG